MGVTKEEVVGLPTGKATIAIERGPITQFAASVTDSNPIYKRRDAPPTPASPTSPCRRRTSSPGATFWGAYPEDQPADATRAQPDDGGHRQADVEGRHRAARRAGVHVPPADRRRRSHQSEGKVVDLYEKPAGDKTMTFLVTENEYRNQDGDLVLTARMNLIHRG